MIKYWVASHISGMFIIQNHHSATTNKGSLGAGFCINRGVTTSIIESVDAHHHIFFNDKEIPLEHAKVTNFILNHFSENYHSTNEKLSIHHSFEVPLTSGYGASAAGAVGTSFALNDFFNLQLTPKEIWTIAHQAEIECGGGLGDVIGLFQGGWEIRIKEGAPFYGKTSSMIEDKQYKIATISFGPMPTEKIIKADHWKEIINQNGSLAYREFRSEPTITNFGKYSKVFSLDTSLATREVREFYKKYSDLPILIGQVMLGNGVFIIYENEEDINNIENVVPEELSKETVKKLEY